MRYIIKNIKYFFLHERTIFIVMLICVLCSSMVINFSYGLYQHLHTTQLETENDLHLITPSFIEDCSITKGELQLFSEQLSSKTLDAIDSIYCSAEIQEYPYEDAGAMYFRFIIRNGQFHVCESVKRSLETEGQLMSGRYFTDDEEATGAHVAIISSNVPELNKKNMLDGNTLHLFSQDYTIIGIYNSGSGCPLVPFLSAPNDLQLNGFGMHFTRNISKSTYHEIVKVANQVMPNKLVFPDLPFPDNDQTYLNNNIMLISILISIISAVNLVMAYLYMIKKRNRDLAIMRICGCTRRTAIITYLGECILLTVPVYTIGLCLYIILLKNILCNLFEYIEEAYSGLAIFSIFLIYTSTVLGLMLFVIHYKIAIKIRDELEEGRL